MQTIDLEGMTLNSEFSQFSWVFEVNDFIGVLPNFRVDPNRGIFAPIPPVEREALVIENVRVREATTDHIRLELSGFHPNGCRVPVRVRTEWIEETLVVDVYRPGALEGRMCPAILLMYNETVTIEGDFEEGVYSYDVNGETGVFTIDGSQAMRQVPHVIEDVQVQVLESSPPQISLVVSGHIPDGCEAETQIDRRQEDNTVFVEIYRELPPFVDCPAVVQDYEDTISLGAFQPGTYTFDVNGVVVTAEI